MAFKLHRRKCPSCNGLEHTLVAAHFYKCKRCGNSFYDQANQEASGLVVSAGNSASSSSKALWYLMFSVILLSVIIYYLLSLDNKRSVVNNGNTVVETVIPIPENIIAQNMPNTIIEPTSVEPESLRDVLVLYADPNSHNRYLYQVALVSNSQVADEQLVRIEQIGNAYVAYNQLTNGRLSEAKKVLSKPLSAEAMVVYADNERAMIKNRTNSGQYQLEMISLANGKINWTLSEKELPELKQITGLYNKETNQGIDVFRKNFRLKIGANYYILDDKGQILGFGKL